MEKPDNPAAFPGGNPSRFDGKVSNGMTLRDWFAGHAMALKFGPSGSTMRADHFASTCYEFADAMLAARGDDSRLFREAAAMEQLLRKLFHIIPENTALRAEIRAILARLDADA